MLRINLLPPYIYEGKSKKRWIAIWSVAAAATVGAFLFYLTTVQNPALEAEKQRKDKATEAKGRYDGLVQDIQNVETQIAETKTKQDFVGAAQVYNDSWRPGFEMVREVVNPRIVLKSVNFDASRSSVIMNGFAPSEEDTIRWWMVLLKQADKFSSVNIALPPRGYEPGGATGAAGATGARPGMPPGSSMGGIPNFAAQAGVSSAGGGSMGGPMRGGGSMGGGAGNGDTGPGELQGRSGFHFVCTAGLTKSLNGGSAPPSWPPVATGANAGGGGMGMMSMPGGSMGMGGGMSSGGSRAGAVQ